MTKTKSSKDQPAPAEISNHSAPSAEAPGFSAFPIVAIGASAGGLSAFEAFFSGMPADSDPNMAFVLVQHLAPDYKSILADLIRRYTRMQVFEVEDGMSVRVNCTYIIPPNRDMAFVNGSLQLLDPTEPRGQRLPIDYFFRSLAIDQHQRSIAIVLSGSGSDGSQGIRAIKGEGGFVIVQTPESSEFDGMPQSAIATGVVDLQLKPSEMAAALIKYVANSFGKLAPIKIPGVLFDENSMKKIFIVLRIHSGHDFSQYKPNTINRRIERRMAVHLIDSIDHYVKFLQQTPSEVEALFHDLLIGVTNFFRDPAAFKVLEDRIIPQLFANKPQGVNIRIWSAGCSTGEEAYSLALLIHERIETLKQSFTVQIFATDIDNFAIARARSGLFSTSIVADISPARLSRFFSLEADKDAYRIQKNIRDMLIFSEQDLIKDPPFSKLDLISCRNLLIYLNTDLQKRLIPLFHYALNDDGFLFLGSSEGIGDFGDLFEVLDRKEKIYQRKRSAFHSRKPLEFNGNVSVSGVNESGHSVKTTAAEKKLQFGKVSLRELTEQALLKHLAPVSALVNTAGDILYLYGRTGMYLEPSPGESGVNNVLRMARDGLRVSLSKALRTAALKNEIVRIPQLSVKTNGHFTLTNLSVCPVLTELNEMPVFLTVFEEARAGAFPAEVTVEAKPTSDSQNASEMSGEAQISALKSELLAKDEYLQSTNEELESANEELKSSNEEMQSVNEELQSTNEELETSKEELQSVNEELATVNVELQTKVFDLSRLNNDMNNLLAGTGIATIFVDHNLLILRFTPSASSIINLIAGDVGRPLLHIVHNLMNYSSLIADVQIVLRTLIPKNIELETIDGHWYEMRIRPYRTLENVIEGAVISFVDNTEIRAIKDALERANNLLRLAVVVRDSNDAITVQNLAGDIIAWNPGATRLYGWSEAEALQLKADLLIPAAMRQSELSKMIELSQTAILQPYNTQRLNKSGAIIDIWMTASALINEQGRKYAIATTERAIVKASE